MLAFEEQSGSTAARREIHDLDVKCIDFEA
jgi:hypothetical protein